MRKNAVSVQYLTRIAVLTALGSILFMIEIPVVAFYKLDLSNLPVLLGAFSMGPMAGMFILLLKSMIGMLHSTSMYVGELADFIMGAAYVLPAALIYRAGKGNRQSAAVDFSAAKSGNRNQKGRQAALKGMLVGTVVMIVVAVLVNWKIMIPFYMNAYGMPLEAVIGMATKVMPFVDTEMKLLLFVTAPFNLLKGIVLSVLTYVMYKRLSPLLHVRR